MLGDRLPGQRRAWIAGLLGTLLVGVLLAWLLVSAGGPPPSRDGSHRAGVASWTLVSASRQADAGGTMCGTGDPCNVSQQRTAAQRGDACAVHATVTLTSHANPLLVHDIRGEVETRATGRTVDRDLTTRTSTRALPWEGGAWWRFETETIDVVAPTPCMVDEVRIAATVRGQTATGDVYALTQTVYVEPLGGPRPA